MWYKQPVKDRIELMRLYNKAYPKFSYNDMLQHFNNGGIYQDGGETDPPVNLRAASTTGVSAISTQAPQVPLNKTGVEWAKEKWDNREPSEWNMMMMNKAGGYEDSGISPFDLIVASPSSAVKTISNAEKLIPKTAKVVEKVSDATSTTDKVADISNKVADSRISTINDIYKLKSERPRNFTENPNKFLSGEWKNVNKNFVNQRPLDVTDFNGIRENPTDPKYLDKFKIIKYKYK